MTPLQAFSEVDGQRRFLAPFLPAPRVTRRDQGQADAPGHIIEAVVTETIRAAADDGPVLPKATASREVAGRLSDSAGTRRVWQIRGTDQRQPRQCTKPWSQQARSAGIEAPIPAITQRSGTAVRRT